MRGRLGRDRTFRFAERVDLEHAGEGLDRRRDLLCGQCAQAIQRQRGAFHCVGRHDRFVEVDWQHLGARVSGQLERLQGVLDQAA